VVSDHVHKSTTWRTEQNDEDGIRELADVHGVSPNINAINPVKELFLKATVIDPTGQQHELYILPDGGNRSKCILRDDIYFKLFPNQTLEPFKDKVSTAVRGGGIQILGTPKTQIEFLLANGRYSYRTRPLIVRNLILPCLFSANDLKKMNMQINYGSGLVTLGEARIRTELQKVPRPQTTTVNTVQRSTIYPGTEMIIPVRTQDILGGRDWLLLPNESVDGFAVASLNSVQPSGLGHLKIVNWSDHPLTIKANQLIGTGCVADETEEASALTIGPHPARNKNSPQFSPSQYRQELNNILKLEQNKHLSTAEKAQLLELLLKYQDVLAKNPQDIGTVKEVKCRIETEPGRTVKSIPRPLPPHLKADLKRQLEEWQANGVIEPAPPNCPWSSPLLPVRKKDGTFRWAVDMRKLNNISIQDHRPIPNVSERLSNLKANSRKPLRYFGSIDLLSAYNHIELDEESQLKTAITTDFGLFIHKRMCFGLSSAPGVFADLIRVLERKLEQRTKLASQILLYFDDALICASSWAEFLNLLEALLLVCRELDLRINPKKCVFGLPSVTWLGHELSDQGIRPAPDLVNTIKNWPEPKNVSELRSLFGTFSYYRRFVPKFAERTEHLRKLLLKDAPFKWTRDHAAEMSDLQQALTTKPILAHPDFTPESHPFALYVDSSRTGVGAVLMQKQAVPQPDGTVKDMEVVIAYASKALNSTEQHYSAYKKELYGLVHAINHFRYYLLGKKFKVCTDHRGLEWLMSTRAKSNGPLVYRWQDVLGEYDLTIEYVSAAKMRHVDGLSRKAYQPDDHGNIRNLPDFKIAQHSAEDSFWIPYMKARTKHEVNAFGRPQRARQLPTRLRDPDVVLDLPPSLIPPPLQVNETPDTTRASDMSSTVPARDGRPQELPEEERHRERQRSTRGGGRQPARGRRLAGSLKAESTDPRGTAQRPFDYGCPSLYP